MSIADRATPPETQHVVDAEDGRRARRDRNRDAVVDALLTLYKEGKLNPSSDEIATRAGLSPRSLFRYFDDIDDLCQAAISRQQSQVRHLFDFEIPPNLTLTDRIALVVDHRVRLFDTVSAAALVARLRAPFQPIVAAEISESRMYLRNQLKRAFKPELGALTPTAASSAVAAIDVLCSFESFHLLRHDQCLSKTKIISTLTDTITTLLQISPQ